MPLLLSKYRVVFGAVPPLITKPPLPGTRSGLDCVAKSTAVGDVLLIYCPLLLFDSNIPALSLLYATCKAEVFVEFAATFIMPAVVPD